MFKRLREKSEIEFSWRNEMFSSPRVGRDTPTFGEISSHLNRFCWKIPRFHSFKKDEKLIIYSPEFFLGDRFCHLFARPWRYDPGTAQSQFLIGACDSSFRYFLDDKNRELSVRFGITGSNVEHSIFGVRYDNSNMIQRKLFGHSEFDNNKQDWVPDGNLHLFIAVEDTAEKPTVVLSSQTSRETELRSISLKDGFEIVVAAQPNTPVFSTAGANVGLKKLQEDFKDIFQNGNVSDVVLKVEGQEFKSHRCILAARSPVFKAMMTHDTKENNTGVVDIQDADHNTFSSFLEYLYTGSMEAVTPENAYKLYTVADKYQVHELKKACVDHMLKNITVDNYCDLLTLSLLHEEKGLTDACTQFFIKNSLAIVKTSKWQIFLSENPTAGNELFVKQLEMNK